MPSGVPEGCPGWQPRRGALTCFPAAAARDFCRNCRSRGSEGAAETVPRTRAMDSRARAHWRRHDSISPAGRARRGGGGEALAAPLRLSSGVGDLLASRLFINPSPDVKAGAPPSPHAAGGGSLPGIRGGLDRGCCSLPEAGQASTVPPEYRTSGRPRAVVWLTARFPSQSSPLWSSPSCSSALCSATKPLGCAGVPPAHRPHRGSDPRAGGRSRPRYRCQSRSP